MDGSFNERSREKDERNQGKLLNFETVFRTYYPRLCYHAFKLLADKDAAADTVQDAFVKYWDRREDFDNEMAVKTFLYITTRNAALNVLRHNKVEQKFVREQDKNPVEEARELGDVIQTEVMGEVYKAIEELPEGAREVFKLGYLKRFKNQEIADQLGVSINTVKTQKARALQLLRLKLNPEAFLLVLGAAEGSLILMRH